jgi:acyl-CoA thioesterase-1
MWPKTLHEALNAKGRYLAKPYIAISRKVFWVFGRLFWPRCDIKNTPHVPQCSSLVQLPAKVSAVGGFTRLFTAGSRSIGTSQRARIAGGLRESARNAVAPGAGRRISIRIRSLTAFAACLVATATGLIPKTATAADSAAESCLAVRQMLSTGAALPRTAKIVNAGGALKIVAIGSSSTVGLWQSGSAATYPGVLQAELMRLKPALRVTVTNSGRSGDTIPGNIARFDEDVFAHAPDLVIWQVGTNDVTWLRSAEKLTQTIAEGIRALKVRGSDVILMDQQYAPVILASQYSKMQASIAEAARQEHVALFSRFELMRRAVDGGLSMSALVAWDGLHNSAAGYDCTGRALARAIVAATDRSAAQPQAAKRSK